MIKPRLSTLYPSVSKATMQAFIQDMDLEILGLRVPTRGDTYIRWSYVWQDLMISHCDMDGDTHVHDDKPQNMRLIVAGRGEE